MVFEDTHARIQVVLHEVSSHRVIRIGVDHHRWFVHRHHVVEITPLAEASDLDDTTLTTEGVVLDIPYVHTQIPIPCFKHLGSPIIENGGA